VAESLTPRAKLRRIGTRLFWRFGLRWYGLTSRRIGEGKGTPVRTAESISDLAGRTSYPDHYTEDRLDSMRHPRLIQARVDARRPLGDCDDHAAYWCAVLLKSGLAERVYLAAMHLQLDGEPAGHAFVIFRRSGDDAWHAADYGLPVRGATAREACEALAGSFGARALPLFAAWMRVELRDDDGLRLRRTDAGKAVWR
jgi:hypothetical protein